MLGQTACAMAWEQGATCVIAIEPDSRRREVALRFGASVAIDSGSPPDEISARVKEFTNGRGADVGLEFAGYPESTELGVGLLRMGGRFIMAGATFPSRPVNLSAEQLVRSMIRISGVYNYSPEDLERALVFLDRSAALYPFEEMVGARYPLREVNAAIAFAESERPPRVALIA
jgi:threonine dehydrogenase-like Zn-dependent dehydrogenase